MATKGPNLGLMSGWQRGERGWGRGINDALRMLDAVVALSVVSRRIATPPEKPQEGDRYLIPVEGAQGPWAEHAGRLAVFRDGGWEFWTPQPGWRARADDEAMNFIAARAPDGSILWREIGAVDRGARDAVAALRTSMEQAALDAADARATAQAAREERGRRTRTKFIVELEALKAELQAASDAERTARETAEAEALKTAWGAVADAAAAKTQAAAASTSASTASSTASSTAAIANEAKTQAAAALAAANSAKADAAAAKTEASAAKTAAAANTAAIADLKAQIAALALLIPGNKK